MNRKDFYIGRLHFIVRGYRERPQYGMLLWSCDWRRHWCLDIWFHQTLYTITRDGRWDW